MLVANRFEELIFWQRARTLARLIFVATHEAPFKRYIELAAQLERFAMSVMGDVAEGAACDQQQDYVSFLYSAIGAATGLQSYLYLALDFHLLTPAQFDDYYNRAAEIIHLIDAFAAQLQEGRRPSPRHHRPS